MAFIIPNNGNRPSKKLGLAFEDKLREYLRVELPDTYAIMHSVILTDAHSGGAHGRRNLPREIDFLVAGPNGLFLIEAKYREGVRGSLFDTWVYTHRNAQGKVIENADPRPGKKMKENLIRASMRVQERGGRTLDGYRYPHGIFVFPDEAKFDIKDTKGLSHPVDRWAEIYNEYFFTRFKDLPALILERPRDPRMPRPSRPNPKEPWEEALKVLRLFEVGTRPDPIISGHYEILHSGPQLTAGNGLPYSIHKLANSALDGALRRGKWYDMSAIGRKESDLFKAQVQRHANVLEKVRAHPNVQTIREFVPDLVGHGYWVIEDWIDGETLDEVLDTPAARALEPLPLMRQVAEGLRAVHGMGFVCRDLQPQSILIERKTARAILTNFEAAKSSEGGPTVTAGGALLKNDYQAPEVRTGGAGADTDARADVYSWGAIFFRVVTGAAYDGPAALGKLDGASLPAGTKELLGRCLSPLRSQRPGTMDAVLTSLGA
ncbi:NERD domain-containing protein kinase family protein [Cystobacter fuscus]|uniref:NERD domain-containing protein kinase family protein n=1 Tax=Cystobacter fuscus TaxID=43 RepID=UPI0037BF4AB4